MVDWYNNRLKNMNNKLHLFCPNRKWESGKEKGRIRIFKLNIILSHQHHMVWMMISLKGCHCLLAGIPFECTYVTTE